MYTPTTKRRSGELPTGNVRPHQQSHAYVMGISASEEIEKTTLPNIHERLVYCHVRANEIRPGRIATAFGGHC